MAAPSSTPTATIPNTPESTSTITPTPTPGPNMENLPDEWINKIDHIETMIGMDGNERIVAIEKLSEADIAAGMKEAKLRVLQWNSQNKEWVPYVPQVGWAGWGPINNNEYKYNSLWDEDIVLPDRKTLKEPLKLSDGTMVPMGYLGDIYFDDEDPNYIAFFQGYILYMDKKLPLGDWDKNLAPMVYLGIPLSTGDWQIYVTVQRDPGADLTIALEYLSMSDFGKTLFDTKLERTTPSISTYKLLTNMLKYGQALVGEPIIQGIAIDPNEHSYLYDSKAKINFIESLQKEQPVNIVNISHDFDVAIIPQSMWDILSQ